LQHHIIFQTLTTGGMGGGRSRQGRENHN
jgi:hypothetical protein